MQYGIQLYSVRDLAEHDLEAAVREAARIGYSSMEFAGFFSHEAKEVRGWLEKYGVTVSGTHTGAGEIFDNFDKTLDYHKTLGNKNIIIPGADLSTAEKLDAFIKNVNEALPKLKTEGITLGFHNHWAEFLPNKDGQIIYDELTCRTSISLEIDTYWAYRAGKDPIALMEKYSDRLIFVHLKDGDGENGGRALGEGIAPVKAVRKKAIEMGIPMVVESENLNPNGVSEIERCFAFLKSLE